MIGLQVAMVQPPPPCDCNNVCRGEGGAGVPIDEGLGILKAAGGGLGLMKAWDARFRCNNQLEGDQPTSDL